MNYEYYDILGVSRNCTRYELKKAYHECTKKYHPDKTDCPDDSKIKQVNQAYETLKDDFKRNIYNTLGEMGVKNFCQSFDLFCNQSNQCINDYICCNTQYIPRCNVIQSDKPKPASYTIDCSLEDLFHGKQRFIRIIRKVQNQYGRIIEEPISLQICVLPGTTDGTQILCENAGNKMFGQQYGDVIITIHQKKHDRFERNGDDLIFTKELSLKQALLGCDFDIITLNKQKLHYQTQQIITPNFTVELQQQGMPILKDPNNGRGKLIIKFKISFPDQISTDYRDIIRGLKLIYD